MIEALDLLLRYGYPIKGKNGLYLNQSFLTLKYKRAEAQRQSKRPPSKFFFVGSPSNHGNENGDRHFLNNSTQDLLY